MTSITFISDLHGYKPKLTEGDLLIIAGDLTARDSRKEYEEFNTWLANLPFKCKIFIGGNHDTLLERSEVKIEGLGIHYLNDSGIEYNGLKIWGSPWTTRFRGQNPLCMAFSVKTELELKKHFDLIPKGIDILISHSPPYGILDQCINGRCGSEMLRQAILRTKPKICCFGHIHENGGKTEQYDDICYINASVVNETYQNINLPVKMVLNHQLPMN